MISMPIAPDAASDTLSEHRRAGRARHEGYPLLSAHSAVAAVERYVLKPSELRPEKAGVGGSIPSLATTYEMTYR